MPLRGPSHQPAMGSRANRWGAAPWRGSAKPGWLAILALVFSTLGGMAAAGAGTALAARDAAAEIKSLNKQALDAFDNLNFDQAKSLLEQALTTAAGAGLGRDPLAARTHLNFGMLWIAGFQKHDEGVEHFRSALKIQPDIAPPPGQFNPETQSAFDETKASFKPEPPRPDATAAAKPPGPGRRPPTGPTTTTPPQTVPAPVAQPPVATNRPTAPAVLAAPAAPAPAASPGATSPRGASAGPAKSGGVVEFGATVPEDEAEGEDTSPKRGILLFLGVGSGFGSAKGHLEANQNVNQGMSGTTATTTNNSWSGGIAASRLAHLAIGAGYLVSPSWLVGLDARIQLVTGTTSAPPYTAGTVSYPAKSPPGSAVAVFARSQWYLSPAPVRPFLSGGLGVGYIRQVVVVSLKDATGKSVMDCGSGHEQCVDTVAGGPLLFAAGGGVAYDLHPLQVLASLTANLGVPQLMLNVDVLVGVGLQL